MRAKGLRSSSSTDSRLRRGLRAMRPYARLVLVVYMLASLWLQPRDVAAYCRASDAVGPGGACVPAPDVPFFFWSRSCVAYSFNEHVFERLDKLGEPEIRGAFRAAFGAWATVSCKGRASFFVEQLPGTTHTSHSEFQRDAPNEMVVLTVDAEHWSELPGHSPTAIAMTLIWHDTTTAEIFDVDMELNLGAGSFSDCVARACAPGSIDLQNTITHEAGHVLGLGHSRDLNSTMAPQARGEVDVDKRSLGADDEAGYCALDLPPWKCRGSDCSCPPAPLLISESRFMLSDSAGCQVDIAGATRSPAAVMWMAALTLVARVRRRSLRCKLLGRWGESE